MNYITEVQTTDIRLIPHSDNASPNIGSLEVKIDRNWYPVCRSDWGKSDAHVACRQLKFAGGWQYDIQKRNENATSNRFLEKFSCSGSKFVIHYFTILTILRYPIECTKVAA